MKDMFLRIKEKISNTFKGDEDGEMKGEESYVELGPESGEGKTKIIVRPFVIEDFEDIKPILDTLREGYTIALINIRPLKDKDLVELKRAINKLKKTTEAIEGDIAGFGEDYIVVTPSFASVYRARGAKGIVESEGDGSSPKTETYE
jgi:SepF-like predicted cell division protein (DUF552 family)